jgi:hypothetical protein
MFPGCVWSYLVAHKDVSTWLVFKQKGKLACFSNNTIKIESFRKIASTHKKNQDQETKRTIKI